MHSFTFKVRCGSDTYVDWKTGKVKRAGKGLLVQDEVAATIAATQDQTLVTDEPRPIVRRIMPVECERLQGMPDGWTDLTGWDFSDEDVAAVSAACGKTTKQAGSLMRKWSRDCPDGPRYKATGNSMAVPVMAWLGRRIQSVAESR